MVHFSNKPTHTNVKKRFMPSIQNAYCDFDTYLSSCSVI